MKTDQQIKDAVKAAQNYDDVMQVCRNIEISSLTTSSARKVLRALRKYKPDKKDINILSPLKIAYLGNITFEPLPDYVEIIAACRSINTEPYIGGYDQYVQDLINDASVLNDFNADIIFINLSLRVLAPQVYSGFTAMDAAEIDAEKKLILDKVVQVVNLALSRQQGNVVVSNFPSPVSYQFGIADQKQNPGESEFYSNLNSELLGLFKNESRVHVLDMERLTSMFGKENAYDEKMYYMAKVPWSEAFYLRIADQLVRHAEAAKGLVKKCLVLDLDNTLWGGVLGESGVHGIKVGHGDGESEAFYDFQRAIHALKSRDILLAICSKNNLEDVKELFEQRTDMPLNLEDFSAVEVSWNMKHDGLERIASSLNIGLDSLVFIDDNPAECELIMQMLPQVDVILLPPDASMYPGFLANVHGFDKAVVTSEDRDKSRQYAENTSRAQHQGNFKNVESYLESLQTEIVIGLAGEKEKMRVHQLFSKTNQFNVTTQRYSMAEVEDMIEQPHFDLYSVQARDRFGDLGIIGLCLIEDTGGGEAVIDSFILSCRAMGRGIETAMLNYIKSEYILRRSFVRLSAKYIPTARNKPALGFYPEQGFGLVRGEPGAECQYALLPDDLVLMGCDWIKVNGRKNHE